jgi:multiple antibiotic resistance protein
MNTSFLSTFAATLFALVNPFGAVPIFIGYVAAERTGVQRFVALLLSLTVLGLLILFLATGTSLLKFFGIDLDSFRIAGGILLLLIGISLVTGGQSHGKSLAADAAQSDWQQAKSVYRGIVIPLAIPLLVGPGAIANVILYAGEVEQGSHKGLYGGLALVCVGISFLVFVILLTGQWLKRALGEVGLSIATRILGLLVASMGIQFITAGVTNVIIGHIAPAFVKQV